MYMYTYYIIRYATVVEILITNVVFTETYTDPLWLDVDDEKFGLMAQMGRVVKVGFIKDLPLLMFHKRFKGAKHPFYAGFYDKAARIDKKYADMMDTCIVK